MAALARPRPLFRQLLLDRCSGRGSTSATAPCVALPPASLQSSSIHGVVCFAAPARPGAMVEMQKDCWEQSLPCRSPAPTALVHLTSMDGGNAEGLLGTIPAMHVRTILAKCPILEIYGNPAVYLRHWWVEPFAGLLKGFFQRRCRSRRYTAIETFICR